MPVEAPLRAIIVDDEAVARQRLLRLLSLDPDVCVIAECCDGREALQALLDTPADLLFLDVQMPEMDGFAVLNALPPQRIPVVVFVTAYDSYAIRAFEASAVDYLLKPFHRERFAKAVERAKTQVSLRNLAEYRRRIHDLSAVAGDSRLAIRSGRNIVLLEHSEIDWIEAASNYVCVHCGKTTHIVRESLNSLEKRLGGGQFVRIHRSTIVNSARIREIRPAINWDCRVFLKDGTEVALSRTFRDRLGGYLSSHLPDTTLVL
jgi:two-component system LytT family response regulator